MKRKLIEKSQELLITCDNPKCDYTIPWQDDVDTAIYINEPCPKCSENLLTIDDYLAHERIIKAIDWINKWFSWTTIFISKKNWEKRKTVSVHVHEGIKVKDETNEH